MNYIGKTRYGQLREDVNRYLKWAYVEAANAVCLQRRFFPQRLAKDLFLACGLTWTIDPTNLVSRTLVTSFFGMTPVLLRLTELGH